MASIALDRTGQKMPLTGFGLWKIPTSICANVVYEAVKAGYRLFDGAADYGNEKEAGEGLKKAIDEGLIKREDVFITTKVWNTHHAAAHVQESAEFQLKLWGLDYFDLYLVHFPISLQYVPSSERHPPGWFAADGKTVTLGGVPLQETWAAVESLVDQGLVRNIGVSNYDFARLKDLLGYARIKPSVLQIEHHPYLVQEPLVKLAKDNNVAITAYSSFGPQSWVEIDGDKNAEPLLTHKVLQQIADAHGKSPAQVLLRWSTQRGIAVIPKSNQPTRLAGNLDHEKFDLTAEELAAITALESGLRFNDPSGMDVQLTIF